MLVIIVLSRPFYVGFEDLMGLVYSLCEFPRKRSGLVAVLCHSQDTQSLPRLSSYHAVFIPSASYLVYLRLPPPFPSVIWETEPIHVDESLHLYL